MRALHVRHRIQAMVHKAGRPSKIVLVTQFRPPCDGNVIELAAGLIDAGETATEAAVRELKEETGKSKVEQREGGGAPLRPISSRGCTLLSDLR